MGLNSNLKFSFGLLTLGQPKAWFIKSGWAWTECLKLSLGLGISLQAGFGLTLAHPNPAWLTALAKTNCHPYSKGMVYNIF